MKNPLKIVLLILMCLYVISPIDAAPGPIDDIIVVVLGYLAQKKIGERG